MVEPWTVDPVVAGSSPVIHPFAGSVSEVIADLNWNSVTYGHSKLNLESTIS